jgi:methyltransferase (TIGR00027 family)
MKPTEPVAPQTSSRSCALGDAGLTGAPGFRDPTARRFLSAPWSLLLGAVKLGARLGGLDRVRSRLAPAIDILPLRTVAIDAALREAVAAGCRQVVILGAGLDGRAHRMGELAAIDVYEVGHPASQAEKRPRSAGVPLRARTRRFVASISSVRTSPPSFCPPVSGATSRRPGSGRA